MTEISDRPSNEPIKLNGRAKVEVADPEVAPPTERRRFTAAYKVGILEEAERCSEPGQIGALLRREGLYSSHLSKWRAQRRQGELTGLEAKRRGRPSEAQAQELGRLQRENEQLKAQLARADMIMAAQKKLCQLLDLPSSEGR